MTTGSLEGNIAPLPQDRLWEPIRVHMDTSALETQIASPAQRSYLQDDVLPLSFIPGVIVPLVIAQKLKQVVSMLSQFFSFSRVVLRIPSRPKDRTIIHYYFSRFLLFFFLGLLYRVIVCNTLHGLVVDP